MIKLKGMYDSMLRCVISEELDLADVPEAFGQVRAQAQKLLPGAKVVLDFGGRPLSEALVCSILSEFVWPASIDVAAWITYDAVSQDRLKKAGLPTSEPPHVPKDSAVGIVPALLLRRSLRSGQRVEHRGDVIVIGHVNDGAEVFASGHVTVLGRLNGLVHAGVEGDEDTTVIARSMEAMQVRIGSKIGSLERGAQWWGKKVIVRVSEGAVLIDYWPVLKGENKEESV